ncbi:MAG: hypothetical protein ACXWDL_12285 [Nocardioides sp.]
MSTISAADVGSSDAAPSRFGGAGEPQPRVRHLAREALVLMTFSATTSLAVAGCLLLLTTLGRQG